MGKAKRNDLEMYEQHAGEWWAPGGFFRSLRGISAFRLALLSAWVPQIHRKKIVDLGCGGGLLSAPLSLCGAKVTGMDLSGASIEAARRKSDRSAEYIRGDIRSVPLPNEYADVVLLADVLDHIPDYQRVIAESRRLLRPGGVVFVNTINRTFLARLLAVTIGETIGLVPKGTHDPALFIRPSELESAAKMHRLRSVRWQGERPDFGKTLRHWAIHFAPCRSRALAYSALLEAE